MNVNVVLDMEQDIWVSERKKRLGLKLKGQVLAKLVRDAMLAEQTFVDEVKEAENQEQFRN